MTPPRRLTITASVLVLGLALTSAPAAAAEPVVELDDGALVVSGLTPGAGVAVLSVWRQRVHDVATRVVHITNAIPDDDAGTVRLELDEKAPVASLWVVVDLASGDFAMHAPEGYPVRTIETAGRGIGRALGLLQVAREDLVVLAVRPGVGAWSLAVSDGGAADDDGEQDGRVTARLGDLAPLGAAPPPPLDGFAPGDVVAAIDSRTMSLTTLRIAP